MLLYPRIRRVGDP